MTEPAPCPGCGQLDPMGDEDAWHSEGCPVVAAKHRLRHLEAIRSAADALLAEGTLVFPKDAAVAIAFVVPCELRDNLADALADLSMFDDESVCLGGCTG